jgi:SAM-dependent methyltransferase
MSCPSWTNAPAPPDAILADIARYYTGKIRRHGPTPLGVDWASELGQRIRFVQLLQIVHDWSEPLSLHDFGCGYGAMLDHLAEHHGRATLRYVGTDVSAEMIQRARQLQRRPSLPNAPEFRVAASPPPVMDYSVASGVFNVRMAHPVGAWEDHVASTLGALSAASTRGLAVNFMFPDALAARPEAAASLYGPPPERWIAYAREVLGRPVRLLSGYGLPEYTLLIGGSGT